MPDPANPSGEPLVYFIHTDHLNTPRVVVDRNSVNRWTWFAEPFGTTAPAVNPSGLGDFTFNLRFPGQYADPESGLFYNYWRHYDSSKGGYTQSDPIGLAGGSPSTYTYVDGNPLMMIDPDGRNAAWALYRSWRFGWESGSELYPVIEPALTPIVDRLLLPDVMESLPALPSSGSKVVPREIWWPDRTAGQWSCKARADCNDNIPGNCPAEPSRRFAFGGGTANDLGTARNIAKANATSNLQCQPKHVSCKCTGPKNEQYSGGC
jgi:RHS repeat-associated protein